jgi:hypothetical protein
MRRSRVCVRRSADFETPPSRRSAKPIILTLSKHCGKRWIGRRISFGIEPCADDTDGRLQKKSLLAGIISRHHHNGICRSIGTWLQFRTCSRLGSDPETKQRGLNVSDGTGSGLAKIEGKVTWSRSKCPCHEPLQTRRTKNLNVATEARSVRIQNTHAFRVKSRSDQCVQCWE